MRRAESQLAQGQTITAIAARSLAAASQLKKSVGVIVSLLVGHQSMLADAGKEQRGRVVRCGPDNRRRA